MIVMKRFAIYTFILLFLSACIKNDLPLPIITPRITAMDVEGATKVEINSDKQIVYVTLDETVDIKSVNIRDISFEDERTTSSLDTSVPHDMSKDILLTLSIYQDYNWKIVANQPIERYFTVVGQVGETNIDAVNHRVITYVGASVDKRNITVSSIKLGPRDITTYSPDIAQMKNFINGLDVLVTSFGRTEKWRIFVENTTTVVEMKSINAWTAVAWVSASGVADRQNGFKYRKQGDSEWIDVANITADGGMFSACIEGLNPLTTYECYAYSGNDTTEIETFTTEEARQMPNSGFESISNDESDKY